MCLKMADDSVGPFRHYILILAAMCEVVAYVRAYMAGHLDPTTRVLDEAG